MHDIASLFSPSTRLAYLVSSHSFIHLSNRLSSPQRASPIPEFAGSVNGQYLGGDIVFQGHCGWGGTQLGLTRSRRDSFIQCGFYL